MIRPRLFNYHWITVNNGLGKHIQEIDMNNMPDISSSMFYLSCLGFVKSSVLVFYTHLGSKTLTRLSHIVLVVIICQAGSFVLVAAFQCTLIEKAWNIQVPGRCVDINAFYLASAALNIATDVLTYVLPIKMIIELYLPRRKKIAIFVVLCFGLFTCIASIIRITYIPIMLKSPDATYVISDAMYWSVIETNTGILTASMPCFKAIFSRFAPRLLGPSKASKSNSQQTQKPQTDSWDQPCDSLPLRVKKDVTFLTSPCQENRIHSYVQGSAVTT